MIVSIIFRAYLLYINFAGCVKAKGRHSQTLNPKDEDLQHGINSFRTQMIKDQFGVRAASTSF